MLLCKTDGSGRTETPEEEGKFMFFKVVCLLCLRRGRSGSFRGMPAEKQSSMIVDVPCNFATAPAVQQV